MEVPYRGLLTTKKRQELEGSRAQMFNIDIYQKKKKKLIFIVEVQYSPA